MKGWEWKFVNDNIEDFNMHILEMFHPSERLCDYEVFRGWFGLGGDWINFVLLHYVKMDLDPDEV